MDLEQMLNGWMAEHADKHVIPEFGKLSHAGLSRMRENVMVLPETRRIMEWTGATEVAIFAPDAETGIQMKGRLDKMSEDDDGRAAIPDIKTIVDASDFERQAATLRYHMQSEWYSELARLNGVEATFVFIAVSTTMPYAVRVGPLDAAAKAKGAEENRRLLNLYAKLQERGHFPSYKVDDAGRRTGMETFTLPRWIHTQPAPNL